MKRLMTALMAGLVMVFMATSASAEVFSISADIPLSFEFTDDCTTDCKADGVSGVQLGVSLPILIGFGVTMVDVEKDSSHLKLEFIDFFYTLPIPFVNIVLGIGAGSAKLEYPTTGSADGMGGHYWVSGGVPIGGVFDVHLAYHKVSATVHDGPFDWDLGGEMYTFGAKFGF